ncbi:MAG: hypothetical protein N3G79_07150, partial [Sulfolobales archaeon]|nr:hypothetical protein [Sulfolobales archaeon]
DTEGNEFVEFPARARVIKTEKGTLVLKPDPNYITHYIFEKCGFRGGSDIEIEKPEGAEIYYFSEYESPKGSLGISTGALVVIPKGEQLIYRWRRSGRLYGRPESGRTLVQEDGSEVELAEEEDELKRVLSDE